MRIIKGSAELDIPVARDDDGNIYRFNKKFSLIPQGREKNYEVFINRNINENQNLRMNFILQTQAGNVKNNINNHLAVLTYNKYF